VHIHPLTRRNKAGDIYERLPEVDCQIISALGMPTNDLLARIAQRSRDASEYLQEETLVYLIQHFHIQKDRPLIDGLTIALLARCATFIASELCALEDWHVRQDAYARVVEIVFESILDLETDTGDYLQVRFWDGLRKRTIDVFRASVTQLDRAELTVSIDDDASSEDDGLAAARRATVERAVADLNADVEAHAVRNERREDLRRALMGLPAKQHQAFVLRYVSGFQVKEIAAHFGCNVRSVNTWLRAAKTHLHMWAGERK